MPSEKTKLPYHEHMEQSWFLYAVIGLVGILLLALVAFFSTLVNRNFTSAPEPLKLKRTAASEARMHELLGTGTPNRTKLQTVAMARTLSKSSKEPSPEMRSAMFASLNQ